MAGQQETQDTAESGSFTSRPALRAGTARVLASLRAAPRARAPLALPSHHGGRVETCGRVISRLPGRAGPQAQDQFGDSGCSAHKARNWARMKSRSSLAGQHLSEPLPLTKCLVTFLHAVPQEPVRVVSELGSPACMITQHGDIHLPRLTDSMGLKKTAALRVSS
jgi:hypothetical protein